MRTLCLNGVYNVYCARWKRSGDGGPRDADLAILSPTEGEGVTWREKVYTFSLIKLPDHRV